MMGCVPTHLQVSMARPSFDPQEAVGICSALKMGNYLSIVSSEPTHTIRTPYLVESEGCQFWPVTMIDTCIQEENDNGVRAHLCRVMEFISQPQRQSFQRRMSSWSLYKNGERRSCLCQMHVVELSLVEPMSLVYSVSDDLWFVVVAPIWCLHSLWGAKKSND